VKRRTAIERAAAAAGPRPRRGSPDQTRRRIVMAAAQVFEDHGYFATDTNRIAAAAGYAAGTFYKHFVDKRAVFLAVYEEWVSAEWAQIGDIIGRGAPPAETAEAIADAVIAHHRAWPRFRASLRALIALDDEVKQHHRGWRRRQLSMVSGRGGPGAALLLLVAERIGDAIADGEAASLGLRDADARDFLVARIAEQLS
jgi:AcrR family transcriptional regulator